MIGTRLDDCQTCHTGGMVWVTDKGGGGVQVFKNACNWCHYIPFPPTLTGDSVQGQPTTYLQTLNPFGLDYLAAGRSKSALADILFLDSDGDGYSNDDEIVAGHYPGDSTSQPGQPICPYITVNVTQIKAMPSHTQFGLGNTNKQQFDFYETYKGVKIRDLLDHYGLLPNATGVDIMAPDGFTQSFSMDEINDQFPDHAFFSGFGVDVLGDDCAFVEYPANTYGYAYGETITDEQWHILAYERSGVPLEESYMDPTTGKINGEGPYRNIIPPGGATNDQNTPDRGKNFNDPVPSCGMTEWNFDGSKDHNAGAMVKGAVILRVQPVPAGCEEFDIQNGGWAMIDAGQVVIYGHSVGP